MATKTCSLSMARINTRRIERRAFKIAPLLHIRVTQQHIDEGIPNCPGGCSFGLALLARGFERVRVAWRTDCIVTFEKGNVRYRYELPLSVVRLTYAVDHLNKDILKPFTVTLMHGFMFKIVPWKRVRDAGGKRRGKLVAPRRAYGRSMRRELAQAALAGMTKPKVLDSPAEASCLSLNS